MLHKLDLSRDTLGGRAAPRHVGLPISRGQPLQRCARLYTSDAPVRLVRLIQINTCKVWETFTSRWGMSILRTSGYAVTSRLTGHRVVPLLLLEGVRLDRPRPLAAANNRAPLEAWGHVPTRAEARSAVTGSTPARTRRAGATCATFQRRRAPQPCQRRVSSWLLRAKSAELEHGMAVRLVEKVHHR